MSKRTDSGKRKRPEAAGLSIVPSIYAREVYALPPRAEREPVARNTRNREHLGTSLNRLKTNAFMPSVEMDERG